MLHVPDGGKGRRPSKRLNARAGAPAQGAARHTAKSRSRAGWACTWHSAMRMPIGSRGFHRSLGNGAHGRTDGRCSRWLKGKRSPASTAVVFGGPGQKHIARSREDKTPGRAAAAQCRFSAEAKAFNLADLKGIALTQWPKAGQRKSESVLSLVRPQSLAQAAVFRAAATPYHSGAKPATTKAVSKAGNRRARAPRPSNSPGCDHSSGPTGGAN